MASFNICKYSQIFHMFTVRNICIVDRLATSWNAGVKKCIILMMPISFSLIPTYTIRCRRLAAFIPSVV